jgi:type IV pilus assembly protein PilC
MFSQQIPLPDLIDLCRRLRHNLAAGVGVVRVMQQLSERGPVSVRPLARRLDDAVQQGDMLSAALQREKKLFPPLFLALVSVGEETGNLPEVLRELEQYFVMELQLRRQFRSKTFPIVLQFCAAVFIIAGLFYVLGLVAVSHNSQPLIGFMGLTGAAASLAFLTLVFGSIAGVWFLYQASARLAHQRAAVDRRLLQVPVLGPCLEAIALSRLTIALQLTLDTGLAITKALRLSLRATANAAYAERADVVVAALKSGAPLHSAMSESRLFPADFLDIVASAEEGGRVPEMMRHQAEWYREEAARRLTSLTRAAAGVVWTANAVFIIWMIFRIAGVYIGAIDGAMK